MPVIELDTLIQAPRERVFDLARSIDAHQSTTSHTREKAIAGTTTGLLEKDAEVTWQATHFGIRQTLKVRMTELVRPDYFQDIMLRGAFHHMRHHHHFEEINGATLMRDRFDFSAPLGLLGRLAESLFLTRYMRNFIIRRNIILKRMAESDEWQRFLSSGS